MLPGSRFRKEAVGNKYWYLKPLRFYLPLLHRLAHWNWLQHMEVTCSEDMKMACPGIYHLQVTEIAWKYAAWYYGDINKAFTYFQKFDRNAWLPGCMKYPPVSWQPHSKRWPARVPCANRWKSSQFQPNSYTYAREKPWKKNSNNFPQQKKPVYIYLYPNMVSSYPSENRLFPFHAFISYPPLYWTCKDQDPRGSSHQGQDGGEGSPEQCVL